MRGLPALAADAAERHAFELDAVLRARARASMPSRVPSQNTRQPRATSFAATASPGNTWPPVPPAVIITVPVIVAPSEHALRCVSPEGQRGLGAARQPRSADAHTVNPRSSRRFS